MTTSERRTRRAWHSTRRQFLKRSAATVASAAVPWIVPASVFGATAPSNRIQVACIGTGNQGIGILQRFMKNDDVQIVAVCDVNTGSHGYKSEDQYLGREPAREQVDRYYAKKSGAGTYKGCRGCTDFREVLASEDVDAVTVVVPDQWHGVMTIRAAEAGKDNKDRCLYRFRFHYDYSGGQVTNYGAHSNDLAQWGLGMDGSGPVEIEYIDAKWLPQGSLFNTALETEFLCRYANGVELVCQTNERPVGVRFEGSEGMIDVSAYPWTARSEPASLISSEFPTGTIRCDATSAHVRNFLDCVRSRRQPVAPVEVGHRSASVCHLGNVAIRLGRNLKWDPQQESFLDDDEANEMLSRPLRSPWQL